MRPQPRLSDLLAGSPLKGSRASLAEAAERLRDGWARVEAFLIANHGKACRIPFPGGTLSYRKTHDGWRIGFLTKDEQLFTPMVNAKIDQRVEAVAYADELIRAAFETEEERSSRILGAATDLEAILLEHER